MAGREVNHKELCAMAVGWLQRPFSRRGPGCAVAVSETGNWVNGEIPDAIGWRPYRHAFCGSVVIEVKVSRSDFLSDFGKPHRRSMSEGMGSYRYFMCPSGVVKPSDLPPKWGLLEVNQRWQIKVVCGHVLSTGSDDDPYRHEYNQYAEISTLAMCLNRVGDPQKLQDRLRELGNMNSRLAKRNAELMERNAELSRDLWVLRHTDGRDSTTPRRPRELVAEEQETELNL